MALTFKDVKLQPFKKVTQPNLMDDLEKSPGRVMQILDEQENLLFRFREDEGSPPLTNLSIELYRASDSCRLGDTAYVIYEETTSYLMLFTRENDALLVAELVKKFKAGNKESVFNQRTEEASAVQYFQFYGYLSQQQNMMQDYIRTSTYQKAIVSNVSDFKDKVVLDVGAGSGILSFFAVQAGARKVYAVEASSMAKHAESLVASNHLKDRISVIPGKIEEINIPEQVDIIISEPMGYMLYNERMLETYLHAKKWLKPGGKMFPTQGDLHVAPFSDSALFMEQLNKANFWYQDHFHGVDLSSLRQAAVDEYFRQPIVDTFDIRICHAKSVKFEVNFEKANEKDLHRMEIPFTFNINTSGEIHGLAFWFDVAFLGTNQDVWLSTSPTQPLTHWYQVRCLVDTPIFLHRGQELSGHVILISNKRQSYDVNVLLNGPNGQVITNTLDLKNPYFRYSGQAPAPPPGTYETSPSEQYWMTLDSQNTIQQPQTNMNNVTLANGTSGGQVPHTTIPMNGNHMMDQMGTMMQMASGGARTSTGVTMMPQVTTNGVGAQVPCSIGGGISPSTFNTASSTLLVNQHNFPVSTGFMIGDYAAATTMNVNQANMNVTYK